MGCNGSKEVQVTQTKVDNASTNDQPIQKQNGSADSHPEGQESNGQVDEVEGDVNEHNRQTSSVATIERDQNDNNYQLSSISIQKERQALETPTTTETNLEETPNKEQSPEKSEFQPVTDLNLDDNTSPTVTEPNHVSSVENDEEKLIKQNTEETKPEDHETAVLQTKTSQEDDANDNNNIEEPPASIKEMEEHETPKESEEAVPDPKETEILVTETAEPEKIEKEKKPEETPELATAPSADFEPDVPVEKSDEPANIDESEIVENASSEHVNTTEPELASPSTETPNTVNEVEENTNDDM